MIAIIQYGVGNVRAIANIYKRLGFEACLATCPDEIEAADRVILPGVGAFDWAMQRLNDSGLRPALEAAVVSHLKPLLGICVGMQMLARSSEEGRLRGLGLVEGEVRRFDVSSINDRTHLPHMGWNDVQPKGECGLFKGSATPMRFYFLHSYYFAAQRPQDVLAVTDYHGEFASGVGTGNVYGVQFHPEKSHQWGIDLLKNFAELPNAAT